MPQRTPLVLVIEGRSWTRLRIRNATANEREIPRYADSARNDGWEKRARENNSCLVDLAAFEVEVEAGQLHVGRLCDFYIAFGAVDDVDVVAKTLDETCFIGGIDAV